MKKVTVILGPNRSDLIVKALAIAEKRSSCLIPYYRREADLADYLGNVEVIILNETERNNRDAVTSLINSNSLLFRKPYAAKSESISRPELIILSSYPMLISERSPFGVGHWIEYINY